MPAYRHGMSMTPEGRLTPLYGLWAQIKQRCTNPKNPSYHRYGRRGIKMCDRWLNSFDNFAADVGAHPGQGWSLDREENMGDYEPGNVRWARRSVQARNTRVVVLTAEKVKAIREALATGKYSNAYMAREYGVARSTIGNIRTGRSWNPQADVRTGETGELPVNAPVKRGKKFTPEMVEKIRLVLARGKYTQREIAQRLGVTQSSISMIATGKIWKE